MTTIADAALPTPAADRPLEGVLWMVASGLSFVAVNAIVKHVGAAVPAAEAAFLRYLLGLVFFVPMLPTLLRVRLGRNLLGIFALRAAVHTGGVILWFYAMTQIPLGEVTAINFLTPVCVTVGAALFLGETLALRRLLAVAAAMLGALVILRPGLRALEPGHVAMLGTVMFFAASYIVAKRLSALASPAVVVALLSVGVTVCLTPFALAHWVRPTGTEVAWLLLTAGFATVGHLTMTLAFRAAPVTVTQPVTFLQLLWAVTLGAVAFGEPVDGYVVAGGLVIMGAVSFITWREAQARRRAPERVDAPSSTGSP